MLNKTKRLKYKNESYISMVNTRRHIIKRRSVKLRSIRELKGKLKGKKVLLRTDYNIPLKYGKKTIIVDNYRIKASLETIRFLLKEKAKIIIISHLGRPKGREKCLSLEPTARELSKLLRKKVYFYGDCIGNDLTEKIECMKNKDILVLENLRFHREEEKNDTKFAKEIARRFDLFVFDAFSVSHRKHASVISIPKFLKTYSGFLFEREVKELSSAMNPRKPFIVLLGGLKISTKIGLIKNFIKKSDYILIGGAMMFTFIKAIDRHASIGKSVYKKDEIKIAERILKIAGKKIVLPGDAFIAKNTSSRKKKISKSDKIPNSYIGLDIGTKSVSSFEDKLSKAKTILWNGPLGYYENKTFKESTDKIARFIARLKSKNVRTIACGGDTLAVINELHLRKRFAFVSTGGGAALSFLSGEELPVMRFLRKR